LDGISAPSQQHKPLNNATRAVVSTFAILVGLAGIEHGFFELLQGNVAPNDMMIDAIGPGQRFWEYGVERALTIIPNFLVTGILAIVFGLLVTTWAGVFIDRKYGAGVLMLISINVMVGRRRLCTNIHVNTSHYYRNTDKQAVKVVACTSHILH